MPRPAAVVPVGARTVTMAAVSFRYLRGVIEYKGFTVYTVKYISLFSVLYK